MSLHNRPLLRGKKGEQKINRTTLRRERFQQGGPTGAEKGGVTIARNGGGRVVVPPRLKGASMMCKKCKGGRGGGKRVSTAGSKAANGTWTDALLRGFSRKGKPSGKGDRHAGSGGKRGGMWLRGMGGLFSQHKGTRWERRKKVGTPARWEVLAGGGKESTQKRR